MKVFNFVKNISKDIKMDGKTTQVEYKISIKNINYLVIFLKQTIF